MRWVGVAQRGQVGFVAYEMEIPVVVVSDSRRGGEYVAPIHPFLLKELPIGTKVEVLRVCDSVVIEVRLKQGVCGKLLEGTELEVITKVAVRLPSRSNKELIEARRVGNGPSFDF